MNEKIQKIKKIIKDDENTDGDYWLNGGNEIIYEILDAFNDNDWDELEIEISHFKDIEHSIFARAILNYDDDRIVKIDNYKFFFKEFILLKDYEDCDCLLFEMCYLENVKSPDLELFNNVRFKIKFLEDFGYSTNQLMLNLAYESTEKAIKKHYG